MPIKRGLIPMNNMLGKYKALPNRRKGFVMDVETVIGMTILSKKNALSSGGSDDKACSIKRK